MDIIRACLTKIKIKDLRQAVYHSLIEFYNRQYRTISRIRGEQFLIFIAIIRLKENTVKSEYTRITKKRAYDILKRNNYEITGNINRPEDVKIFGVPLQKYSQEYFFGKKDKNGKIIPQKTVKSVFDELTKQYPFDPASVPDPKDAFSYKVKHINSLRNRAEMEVRYDDHLRNIEELRNQGCKLVIASTHSDCSERCKPWQGKVYSLDGTEGTTPDGRPYIPLERATDVYYTTKSKKVYKNGLLGFNCRHYLVPYQDGFRFTKSSEIAERKEYKITLKQREMERNVRYYRTRAIMSKGVDDAEYKRSRDLAVKWNNAYIEFSKDSGRAYYPSRTKIL